MSDPLDDFLNDVPPLTEEEAQNLADTEEFDNLKDAQKRLEKARRAATRELDAEEAAQALGDDDGLLIVNMADVDPDDEVRPLILQREDGHCLIYPGCTHTAAGESESGKSWIAAFAAVQVVSGGGQVAYLDFEDREATLSRRLSQLGLPRAMQAAVTYLRVEVDLQPPTRWERVREAVRGAALVVVDGVTEAMVAHGLSPFSGNTGDPAVWSGLVERIRAMAGDDAAVLSIDHTARAGGGRFAIGSQHKMAALSGCAFIVTVEEPLAPGVDGELLIHVGKDRHGAVRAVSGPPDPHRLALAARFLMSAEGRARLLGPNDDAGDGEVNPLTRAARRASEHRDRIRNQILGALSGGSLNTSALMEVVQGRRADILAEKSQMEAEGLIEGRQVGRSVMWEIVEETQ